MRPSSPHLSCRSRTFSSSRRLPMRQPKRLVRTESRGGRCRDSNGARDEEAGPRKDWSETIKGVTGDHVHESHLIPEDLRVPTENVFDSPRKKRPVAVVFAYVGNDFKGNTQNVLLPRGSTVDDVIEDAIFNAGGILLPNYRSKGLQRLKWSRSSRTDKGVSSLFTVVGLRMETPVRAHGGGSENESETSDGSNGSSSGSNSSLSKEEIDAEAKELIVEKINQHLPTDAVKAFACFKATKSFDARRAAISRTYEYLLPLKCLRDNKNGELEVFREALKTFEGAHPFHNYTKRGLYGAGKGNNSNRGRGKRNRKNDVITEDDGLEETSSEEGSGDEGAKVTTTTSVVSEEEKYLPKRIETSGKHTYWLLEKDVEDLVHIMHYRRIHEFTCSKEPEIIDGFESCPFVRVKVYGESFMLHQIRKMIATAVLVALDSEETPTMPLSFIKASLCRPCRVATPLAPPLTLFLTGAEFMSFRKTQHGTASREEAVRSLTISDDTKNDIDRFRRERLYPKLAESFGSKEWDLFIEALQKFEPTREEYLTIVKQYESYDELRQARAKDKAVAAGEQTALKKKEKGKKTHNIVSSSS